MIDAFLSANLWTLKHAFIQRPYNFWADYWYYVPAFWLLAFFAEGLPKLYLIILGLFMLENLLVPVTHYMIPAIPFLCLLAASGFRNLDLQANLWALILCVILSYRLIHHTAADLIRPWHGLFGGRVYSVTDTQYIAGVLKPMNLPQPVWTSDLSLYLAMGWKVPTFDVYNGDQVPGAVIDWSKPPFDKVQTRVELLPCNTAIAYEPEAIKGWSTSHFPLSRSKYTTLRIRRRTLE